MRQDPAEMLAIMRANPELVADPAMWAFWWDQLERERNARPTGSHPVLGGIDPAEVPHPGQLSRGNG